MIRALPTLLLSSLLLATSPAMSADDARIERLEKDMSLLQREVYRDGVPEGASAPAGAGSGNAQMEVRFSAVEEKFRKIQGKLEELEFENRKLKEMLERYQKDNELRFTDMQKSMAAAPAPQAHEEVSSDKEVKDTEAPADDSEEATETPADTTQPLALPDKEAEKSGKFKNSRDHYNHAFKLLNQTQFDAAGKEFESFAKQYPKDPLVGNAFYWAGETYYVRQKYPQAANYFRQGFEAMPKGPKAGDNLLKLAMSLGNSGKEDDKAKACIVLKQVAAKFGANSETLKKKAESERSTLGCK